MPKTPAPPSGRGGSSRRTPVTKVSKPFPWGTVLGSVVLAAVLIGILAYAVLNTGSGVSQLATDPDNNIDGLVLSDEKDLTRNHVQGQVDYPSVPPTGGDHNIQPQQCAVYTEPVAPEHAVHSLEHGAVWVTYEPSLAKDQVGALTEKVEGDPYVLLSPLPDQESPIVLTAWGRQLSVDSADDARVEDFVDAYTSGPQTPEPGAACIGNTTTGPVQGAAAPAPSGAASAPAG